MQYEGFSVKKVFSLCFKQSSKRRLELSRVPTELCSRTVFLFHYIPPRLVRLEELGLCTIGRGLIGYHACNNTGNLLLRLDRLQAPQSEVPSVIIVTDFSWGPRFSSVMVWTTDQTKSMTRNWTCIMKPVADIIRMPSLCQTVFVPFFKDEATWPRNTIHDVRLRFSAILLGVECFLGWAAS